MRVTNSMLVSTLLKNLSTNTERLNKYQDQLASEMRINKLSDDPLGVVTSLRARNSRAKLDMYQTNLDSAASWLESGETALMDVNTIIQEIYVNTVDAAMDGKTGEDRVAIAQKVREFRDQLVQTLNTTLADKYVFGGYNNLNQPFDVKNGSLYYNSYRMDASADTELNFEQFQADTANSLLDVASASADPVAGITSAKEALDKMIAAARNVSARSETTVDDIREAMKTVRDDLALNEFNESAPNPQEQAIIDAMDGLLTSVDAAIAKDAGKTLLMKNINIAGEAAGTVLAKAKAAQDAGDDVVTTLTNTVVKEYNDEAFQARSYPALLTAEGEKKYEVEVGFGLRIDVCMNGVTVMGMGDQNLYTILDELYNALMSEHVDPVTDAKYMTAGLMKEYKGVVDAIAASGGDENDAMASLTNIMSLLNVGITTAESEDTVGIKIENDKCQAVYDAVNAAIDGSWSPEERAAAGKLTEMIDRARIAGISLQELSRNLREMLGEMTDLEGQLATATSITDVQDIVDAQTLHAESEALQSTGGKRTGSTATDVTPFIGRLQGGQKDILALMAIYGGRVNRCEILTSRYEIDYINYTARISNVEDINTAETIMWLKMAESVYNAALSAGANIIQPTLMDFLR